jgi:hypothetical protein
MSAAWRGFDEQWLTALLAKPVEGREPPPEFDPERDMHGSIDEYLKRRIDEGAVYGDTVRHRALSLCDICERLAFPHQAIVEKVIDEIELTKLGEALEPSGVYKPAEGA